MQQVGGALFDGQAAWFGWFLDRADQPGVLAFVAEIGQYDVAAVVVFLQTVEQAGVCPGAGRVMFAPWAYVRDP